MSNTIERLARAPFLDGVGEDRLRALARAGDVTTHPPGRVVFRAGEPAEDLYVILSGHARALDKPRARELGPGDYFGEMALFDDGPRSATVAAVDELTTLALPPSAIRELCESEPDAARVIAAELSWRVRRLEGATNSPSFQYDADTGGFVA